MFSACQKDEMTVTLKTSGSLKAQLIDSNGNKFNNEKVFLYATAYIANGNGSTSYTGKIVTKKRTITEI